MSPWYGRALWLLGMVAVSIVRAPYARRSAAGRVVESRKGPLEVALLSLLGIGGALLPLVAIATPALAFADYPLSLPSMAAGIVVLLVSLWLFFRSHRGLGRNWSGSLEICEGHTLITSGIYRHIRHPMYASALVHGVAQAFFFPNWIAGPAFLVVIAALFALRIGPEERMMLDTFGSEYESYRSRTKRLIPRVW